MELFNKHKSLLDSAVNALQSRNYFSPYPESPRAYDESADAKAREWLSGVMNNDLQVGTTTGASWHGEEISPFLQVGLGVKYPVHSVDSLIQRGQHAHRSWSELPIDARAGVLIESLERVKSRFFDIAYATMHTTGQAFMMAFQASGPHASDRALEAIAMGYAELTRFVQEVDWVKPMGKFDLKMHKDFIPVPKGLNLVIGCSTFPVWNTVPGLYAALITGNAAIVKPHPKAVLPIAIVIEELHKVFNENGINPDTVQLAADSAKDPVTKKLAEHPAVKVIDFTGSSEFGAYVEGLDKTTFTEKAGVNSVLIDSVSDLKSVMANLAFSASLYSGQMCTAPQNIFIGKDGIRTPEGTVTFDDAVQMLTASISGLVENPKAGPGTLGAIQSETTFARVQATPARGGVQALAAHKLSNPEFPDARLASPIVITLERHDEAHFSAECFGPVVFVIRTNGVEDSLALAKDLAARKGALTCGAYSTDIDLQKRIAREMNSVFVPVSFNFTGAGFINSHAAFSDFHLTGGNPAGNASYVNPEFVNGRYVWVGNRYM
jgi:phenylacetic acid degradation protein paaN